MSLHGVDAGITNACSTAEMQERQINEFASLFAGRSDAYGLLWGECVREPVTMDEYRKHLCGDQSLGIYPLSDDGACRFAVVDIDDLDRNPAIDLRDYLLQMGLRSWIEVSKSKGHHVWLFFGEPVSSALIRSILRLSLDRSGVASAMGRYPEVFPKQDALPIGENGVGNYINLPYFACGKDARRVVLADDHYTPLPLEDFLLMAKLGRVTADQLKSIAEDEELPIRQRVVLRGNPMARLHKMPPCLEAISHGVQEGQRDEAMFHLACYFRSIGLPSDQAVVRLNVTDRQNKPNLGGKVIEQKVRSAYSKEYAGLPCNEPLLQQYCKPGDCEAKVDVSKSSAKSSSDRDAIIDMVCGLSKDTPTVELLKTIRPELPAVAKLTGLDRQMVLVELEERFGLKKATMDALRTEINAYSDGDPEEDEKIYKAKFEELVDIVDDDGKPAFLIIDNGVISVCSEWTGSEGILIPPPRTQMPWLLPRAAEVLSRLHTDSDRALYEDLRGYLKEASELPCEGYYDLAVVWVMHTYLQEKVQYSPILSLFAVPERGKSRTGKALTYVAYRGVHCESLREAYLFRLADRLGCSIFLDVMDIWRKAERSGSEDLLLCRFEKGAKVVRVTNQDRGPFNDTTYYDIFGPTIIATNEAANHILETRSVMINMPQTNRRFDVDIKPEAALYLKERLVAFRMRHFSENLPEMPKPVSGRLGDIIRPLLQTAGLVGEDVEQRVIQLTYDLEQDRKVRKVDSVEARVLVALVALEDNVKDGVLPVSSVTAHVNQGQPERLQFTPQKVGRLLESLGFQKAKVGNNSRGVYWNRELLGNCLVSYGLR